ncbi:MAG: hypothetical protein Kow00123_24260 [Anaerolineales bacterium]
MDALLTTRQLQQLLQVDRITIYRMLADGRLRGIKVGGQWRFPRQEIERWLQEQRAATDASRPAPDAEVAAPSPQPLPLSCVRAIQDIFAEALGVASVTTAADGSPLTPVSNCCAFCRLVLDTEEGRRRCESSWREAGLRSGSPRLLTCHAGLRYLSGRIEVHGQFVAAVHVGQFVGTAENLREGWADRLRELAAATGVPAKDLEAALPSVHVLTEERQKQMPRLLGRVAATFSEIGEERLNLLGRLQRIAEMTAYP